MKAEELCRYLDDYLGIAQHPDYPTALNGLQVEGHEDVLSICAAVDASEAAIAEAVRRGADLLLVHHGLFWEGLKPVTGRHYRKLARLIAGRMAVYSVHLPLDSHPVVGNCALLAKAIGVGLEGGFGSYRGAQIGCWGTLDTSREDLKNRLAAVLQRQVRLIDGGPEQIRKVAVVTGGGGSFLEEAARARLDALVSGEGSHHTYADAMELRVNLYYGGHYATETAGVQALARHLEERFGLGWEFLDFPTGL